MERIFDENGKNFRLRANNGTGFGIIMIIAGVLFLLYNLGFMSHTLKSILISWQSLLIVLGLVNLLAKREYTSGTVLLLVGGFFMIPKLIPLFPYLFPYADAAFTRLYWPFLLIAVGIVVLCARNRRGHRSREEWERKLHGPARGEVHGGNGYYEKNAIFSDTELIVIDPVFCGGEFNSVFGHIQIDLRNTSIPEGDTVIETNAVFGGVTVYVPVGWTVVTDINSVFGGFADKRQRVSEYDTSRRLMLRCSCVFGGGEIRN